MITITCRLNITSASSLLGKRCCSSTILFHFVPTLERTTREGGTAGKEFSVCVPERNTVRVLHCNSSLHRESFVASFAPSRLRHSLPSMKSKALKSKFRYQAVFVRAVVIVVLTEHRLVSAMKPSRSENSTEARLCGLPSNTRPAAYPFAMERT